jgi:hypothetical protein
VRFVWKVGCFSRFVTESCPVSLCRFRARHAIIMVESLIKVAENRGSFESVNKRAKLRTDTRFERSWSEIAPHSKDCIRGLISFVACWRTHGQRRCATMALLIRGTALKTSVPRSDAFRHSKVIRLEIQVKYYFSMPIPLCRRFRRQ